MRYVIGRNARLLQTFKRQESDDETGIIALESELDTAIRVLNYRLSLTTDNVTHTIYAYRISLLKRKILKTHKKLATSVSSLVPVSPNKYASLVVEDVLCFLFCHCTVYGGPKKWPGTRRKRGCA